MKILTVIDMQNSFITGELANKEAEKILPRVAELIKNFDGRVIFTRDTHNDKYLETNEGKHLPTPHCIKGTYGQQIHRDLLGWRDATVINKDTFGSISLIDAIKHMISGVGEQNVEIHICGTVSEICVITNALLLKTYFPEAKIIVHRKHCAGMDKKGQDAAMLVMERCQIEIED